MYVSVLFPPIVGEVWVWNPTSRADDQYNDIFETVIRVLSGRVEYRAQTASRKGEAITYIGDSTVEAFMVTRQLFRVNRATFL